MRQQIPSPFDKLRVRNDKPKRRPLLGSIYLSSKRRMAPAMVVVQRPFLSPTADWVTLAVRTILLEMR